MTQTQQCTYRAACHVCVAHAPFHMAAAAAAAADADAAAAAAATAE